jgi:hypothetical protein
VLGTAAPTVRAEGVGGGRNSRRSYALRCATGTRAYEGRGPSGDPTHVPGRPRRRRRVPRRYLSEVARPKVRRRCMGSRSQRMQTETADAIEMRCRVAVRRKAGS